MVDSTLRIDRNMKIINSKKKELWDVVQKRDFDEVYRVTVELTNWIVNTDDWFNLNDRSYVQEKETDPEINGTLFGIRQAYNSFKHNMSITSIEDKVYLDSIFPNIQLEQINWVSSEKLSHKRNNKEAFKGYQEYLDGDSIIPTLYKAIDFLNMKYAAYKQLSV